MYRICVILILIVVYPTAYSQPLSKEKGKVDGISYSYYVAGTSQPVKGIVLLMPSRGEPPKKLFWHTTIPRHLSERGFITIVPAVDYSLILTEKTSKILDHVITNVAGKAGIDPSRLLIGGFSSGGAIAARYAEEKLSKDTASVAGVFLIDPPLDLTRFYTAWTPLINSKCPEVIKDESRFIRKYVEQVTGGTPAENLSDYLKHSAFLASDSLGGNAKFLQYVPIRLYTEPDLKAMQLKYCQDISYQNLNSSDLDALNKRLLKLGNKRVEYIRTTGRGLHSWNIVDPENLGVWADKLIE